MENVTKIVADNIRHYRELLSRTQMQMAEYCHVVYATWQRWETGKCFPRAADLGRIAQGLSVSVFDLFRAPSGVLRAGNQIGQKSGARAPQHRDSAPVVQSRKTDRPRRPRSSATNQSQSRRG